jgi:hypothetical protein
MAKKTERLTLEQIASANPGVEYRPYPDCDAYLVGDDGQVWSCWEQKPIAPFRGSVTVKSDHYRRLSVAIRKQDGYPQLTLRIDGKSVSRELHAIVLLAFRGQPPAGLEGCHDDGVPTNCCLSNLRYDTRRNNHHDRYRHGTSARGEGNGRAKLTKDDVIAIRNSGQSRMELSRQYGISKEQVRAIAVRKSWAHI